MNRTTRVLLIVSLTQLLSVINASTMAVVAPDAALDLNADLPTAQWFILGSFLAIAAFLVPAGRMGDLIGRKPLFIAGSVLFLVGSVVCALSPTAGALIAGRLIVGAGASLLQGNAVPLLISVYPADRRGTLIAGQVSVVGVGGVLGPLVGGLIVEAFGWRALMWIFCLLAISLILLCSFALKRRATRPVAYWSDFDWAGAGLSALLLVTMLVSLTFAPARGWFDPWILSSFLIAALLLAGFLIREATAKTPMLRLSMFRLPSMALGALGTLALFMSTSSMRFLIPFHLQYVQGLGPRLVGFLLVPAAVALIVVSPIAGRMADRHGPRRIAAIGLALMCATVLALATVDAQTQTWVTCIIVMMVGVSMSVFHAPNGAAMINAVGENEHGVASSIQSLSRNVGNLLGVSLATLIVTTVMTGASGQVDLSPEAIASSETGQRLFIEGMQTAFSVFASLVAMMMLLSLWAIRRTPTVASKV